MQNDNDWIERIASWVETPSGTWDEAGVRQMARRLVEVVEPLCDEIEVREQGSIESWDDSGERVTRAIGPLIVARRRVHAPRQILLGIHYDTVYDREHPIRICRREGDRLIGPGAADAKGGIAVMLAAIQGFEALEAKDSLGWELFLNADEEIGSPVTKDYFSLLGGGFDFAMLYEPTVVSGAMVSRRKGSGNFHGILRGRAAHAGRDFAMGRNAVIGASQIADRWNQLNGRWGSSTFNVGQLKGGGPLNMVPALASFGLNVRVDRLEDMQEIEARVRQIATEVAQANGLELSLRGGITSPPKEITQSQSVLMSGIEKVAHGLGRSVSWVETGGVCDGNKLAAFGVPNVDTFGVRGDRIHSAEEWMSISSLSEQVALSMGVMQAHAKGDIELSRRR